MTRPINGRVIQQRNRLASMLRDVWNEDTLEAVARVLKARET